MLTAKEANKLVSDKMEEILNTKETKSILAFFEKKIKSAAMCGEKSTSFKDDDIVDENNNPIKMVYIGSFYGGNYAIKNFMHSLGYSISATDHGHITISW